MLHCIVWLFFLGLPYFFFNDDINIIHLSRYIFRSLLLVGIFYTNSHFLIPVFLSKNKIGFYILILLALIGIFIFLNALSELIMQQYYSYRRHHSIFFHIPRSFFAAVFILGLSTSYRMTIAWFDSERQKKELENEKLISELAFLKSQINPHFFFNTLNNLYSLAYKKSDETPDAIVKLSKLMRYMLYESNENRVFLSKEIEYINNYIDLQKLRLPGKVDIKFDVAGDAESLLIEPMLLIPFVENAFKHGISYAEDININISIAINQKELIFTSENKIFKHNSDEKDSGIGLLNVKRRLSLLYPGKHKILIKDNDDTFRVVLKICLEKC